MYYLLYISHPDFPDTRQIWLPLSDILIAEFQEFIKQEFNKFKKACPDDANNESLWHDWLDDAFADVDFTVELPGAINPVPAHIEYIDLENPKVSI